MTKSGDLIDAGKVSLESWEEYFTRLYKEDNKSPLFIIGKIEITEQDVEQVVYKLKKRKSPGLVNISNELLKYGGFDFIRQLTFLVKKIFQYQIVPKICRTSILMQLFKKDEKLDQSNYRRIYLLDTPLKLITKIIHNLTDLITLEDEQKIVRSGRSCVDAVFVM